MNLIKCKAWNVTGKTFDWETWNDIISIVRKETSLNIISTSHHLFDNGGFTGLILLSESHLAVHSWPEYEYYWIELASCGDISDFIILERWLEDSSLSINTAFISDVELAKSVQQEREHGPKE